MSTNTLGRSERFGQYWSGQKRHLAEEITLTSVEEEPVPDLEAVEDYPFSGQIRTVGAFEYQMSPSDDFSPAGTFEYRHISGLFLLSTEASVLKNELVISKINQQLSRDAEIDAALSVTRDRLWGLLERAESVRPFRVSGPEGEYDLNSLLAVVRHQDRPAKAVEKLHRNEDIEDYDVLTRVVDGLDIPEEIHSVTDLDIDLFEHRIIKAEAEFSYDEHEFVTITYNRGSIEIDADSDESREYAVQMIERDLIYTG